MTHILWTLLGLAVLWLLCTVWACCVAAGREDKRMEGYDAQYRNR